MSPSVAQVFRPEEEAARQRIAFALRRAQEELYEASVVLSRLTAQTQWSSRGIIAFQEALAELVRRSQHDLQRVGDVRGGFYG